MVTPTTGALEQSSPTKGDEWTSTVHNGVINLKQWRDEFGHGDIGAAWNDAAQYLASNTNGGTIYLPAGDYSIDTRILWTQANVPAAIRWVGAGRQSTDVSTTLTDRPIVIGDLSRAQRPLIKDISFDISGMTDGETFLMLGDDTGTYTAEKSGPTFPVLEDVAMQGNSAGNRVAYHFQDGFWIRATRLRLQQTKAQLGVSGNNWGNQGTHIACHYDNKDGDYGIETLGTAARHRFIGCKFVGGTNAADLSKSAGAIIMDADTELAGGGVLLPDSSTNLGTSDDSVYNPVPNSGSNMYGPSPTAPPSEGVLHSPDFFLGADQGPAWNPTDSIVSSQLYANLKHGGHLHQHDVELMDYDFDNQLPNAFQTDHSGTASSSTGIGGYTLSTGTTANSIARIDQGDTDHIALDKYPVMWLSWTTGGSVSDVRIELGLSNEGGGGGIAAQLDTSVDQVWDTFYGGGRKDWDTAAANTYCIAGMAVAPAAAVSGTDNVMEGFQQNGTGFVQSRGHTAGFTPSAWDPYVEIENLAAADKTLTIHEFIIAQRREAGTS